MPRGKGREAAFAAAMLHDIGWLVLAAQEPEHVADAARMRAPRRRLGR